MRTAYTDWVVRTYVCAVCGRPLPDPHHVRTKGALGKQVDEGNVVPLCRDHHTGNVGVHFLGKRTFAARFSVCLPGIALNVLADWLERGQSSNVASPCDMEF